MNSSLNLIVQKFPIIYGSNKEILNNQYERFNKLYQLSPLEIKDL